MKLDGDTSSNQDGSQASTLPNDVPAPARRRLERKGDDEQETKVSPKQVAEDTIKSVLPNQAEIVPGSIQVSPLRQMAGILIDLIVMIKMKSGGSRTVNMQIECPNFTPRRIRIDGVWHSIV
ncbi:hypothetical protein TELCIR_21666 [Teladorsagia circumcincta]|uniref:Uncharacterized protein n=1 Tax=Teladorsagia circumcincta TaxID=45464 RepID=A0A2G9THC2_TELCI|nr:hypothetical protein TELCIR_21666 [Teladorsagia circumcincta]